MQWRQLPNTDLQDFLFARRYLEIGENDIEYIRDMTDPINGSTFDAKYKELSRHDLLWCFPEDEIMTCGYFDGHQFIQTNSFDIPHEASLYYDFEPNNLLKIKHDEQTMILWFDWSKLQLIKLYSFLSKDNSNFIARLEIQPEQKILRLVSEVDNFITITLNNRNEIVKEDKYEIFQVTLRNGHLNFMAENFFSSHCILNHDGHFAIVNRNWQRDIVNQNQFMSVIDCTNQPATIITALPFDLAEIPWDCWTHDSKLKFMMTTGLRWRDNEKLSAFGYYDCFTRQMHGQSNLLDKNIFINTLTISTEEDNFWHDNLYYVRGQQKLLYFSTNMATTSILILPTLPTENDIPYHLKLLSGKSVLMYVGQNYLDVECYIFGNVNYKLLAYYQDQDSKELYQKVQLFLMSRLGSNYAVTQELPEEMVEQILRSIN